MVTVNITTFKNKSSKVDDPEGQIKLNSYTVCIKEGSKCLKDEWNYWNYAFLVFFQEHISRINQVRFSSIQKFQNFFGIDKENKFEFCGQKSKLETENFELVFFLLIMFTVK